MAWIAGDGFDLYNAAVDIATSGVWDSASVITNAPVAGRIGNSKAYSVFTSGQFPQLIKSSGSNDQTHHVVFAFSQSAVGASGTRGFQITFYDGTLAQCSFMIEGNTGNLLFYSGNLTTLLGTFAGAVPLNGNWTAIEIEVTIHNTAGAFHVRLNGNTVDDFALTGVNTRAGSTNAYANKLQMGTNGSLTNLMTMKIDDFLWFSTSGAAPNTWVGDIRCDTRLPAALAAGTLSPASSTYSMTPAAASSTTTNWPAARILTTTPITSTGAGVVTSLSVTWGSSAFTGKWKLAIYDGTGGTPGALLGQTAEQTNATASTSPVVPLLAPVNVSINSKYFVAILYDNAITSIGIMAGASYPGLSQGATYASGFPANLGNPSLNQATASLWATMILTTVDNATFVSQSDADTTYVYSATIGANDLYTLQPPSSNPVSVLAVQTRLLSRKSDTGTRQARVQVKSGGTVSNGSNFVMGTSYAYTNKLDAVDPATGAAWTVSAVNSLQIGAYVVA